MRQCDRALPPRVQRLEGLGAAAGAALTSVSASSVISVFKLALGEGILVQEPMESLMPLNLSP